MKSMMNPYTSGRIHITYTGECGLIKLAVQNLKPQCSRLKYDTNIFLVELSDFRTLYNLKQHFISIQEFDPLSSVVLIVNRVEFVPIPDIKFIKLTANREEWINVLISAALNPLRNISRAIEACEKMLCQNELNCSQHLILQLIAQGFDIPDVSAMSNLDLKYVYSVIANMREKFKIKSLHHFMMYVRHEFNYSLLV
jgi:hypothetical protein